MKAVRTWIVVADGANARILLNKGPGKGISHIEQFDQSIDHSPSRDIDGDRPGRSFDSGGDGRHAMEPTSDAHRENKREFASHIVKLLNREFEKNQFDRLVLVAAPSFLGDLRANLPKSLKDTLHGELAKDLTHEPIHTIGKLLESVIIL